MGYIRSYRKKDGELKKPSKTTIERKKEVVKTEIERTLAGNIVGQSDSSVLRIATVAILNGLSFGDVQDQIEDAAEKIINKRRRKVVSE
jgi:hypothetical protein